MKKNYNIRFTDVNACHWWIRIEDQATYTPAYNAAVIESVTGGARIAMLSINLPTTATQLVFTAVGSSSATFSKTFTLPGNGIYSLDLYAAETYFYYFTLSFSDKPSETIYLSEAASTATEIELKAADAQPLVIKTVNNSEDKLSCIRATAATFKFLNEDGATNISTFVENDSVDTRWLTTIKKTAPNVSPSPGNFNTHFVGFLALDDLSEPLQEPANVVTLTATDRLGALKDIPLTNDSGSRPYGPHPLIKYIAWALAATGLSLTLACCDATLDITQASGPEVVQVTDAYNFKITGNRTSFFAGGDMLKLTLGGTDYSVVVYASSFSGGFTNVTTTGVFNGADPLPVGSYPTATITYPGGGGVAMQYTHVDAKTFDKNITEKIDASSVLTQLLSPMYFVTQRNGEWWIVNVRDLRAQHGSIKKYHPNGDFYLNDSYAIATEIGRDEQIALINKTAMLSAIRGGKEVRVNYNFSVSEKKLLNEDYTQGLPLSSSVDVDQGYQPHIIEYGPVYGTAGATAVRKGFNLDGWTLNRRENSGVLSAANTIAFIKRYYKEDVEKFRDITIARPPEVNVYNYVLTNDADVLVEKGDTVLFSFEMYVDNYFQDLRAKVAQVLLLGATTGKTYALAGAATFDGRQQNKWYEVPSANPNIWWGCPIFYRAVIDNFLYIKNDWANRSDGGGEFSEPFPEDGVLKVRLAYFAAEFEKYASGSYQIYPVNFRNIKLQIGTRTGADNSASKGQYSTVAQAGAFTKKTENEIFIDNASKREYKGVLLVQDGDDASGYGYSLGTGFKHGAYMGSWGGLMADTMAQQLLPNHSTLRGDVMLHGVAMPDMAKTYEIEPDSLDTRVKDKRYMLLSYEHDVRAAQVRNMVLAQIDAEPAELSYSNGFIND